MLDRRSRFRGKALVILAAVILAAVVYAFLTIMETTPPEAEWTSSSEYLGRVPSISITAADTGTGLRSVRVMIDGDKSRTEIFSKDFTGTEPPAGDFSIELAPDLKKLGIKEGESVLVLEVRDLSLWRSGNTLLKEYPVIVDTTPPRVELISRDHVVFVGGSEAVIFKTSPDTASAGVRIEENFFQAYGGAFENEDKQLALFSYPYGLKPGKSFFLEAVDMAGNIALRSLPVLVKAKEYRKRQIGLSDSFLESKIPELLGTAGIDATGDLLEDFFLVNKDLRKRNEESIASFMKASTPEFLWEGRFLQMRNSSVEARFADFRTYKYKGKAVDKLYHLGVDLAAVRKSPIESANGGTVVFADDMGIYGNTVIVDHGFGLFTLYSHMSSIDVFSGEGVEKGQILGSSGSTGFAGGDHLHFGVFLHETPVLPLEWWDGRWIRNRILKKIDDAR